MHLEASLWQLLKFSYFFEYSSKRRKEKFKNLINWHTDTDIIMYPLTEQPGNFKCVFLSKKLIGFIPGRTLIIIFT